MGKKMGKKKKSSAPERITLEDLEKIDLKHGGHMTRDAGMCVMEATSYFAGEPHSASPECVPVSIRSFLISLNDVLETDEERNRLLRSYIPRIVGLDRSPELEQRRAWLAVDWIVREFLPAWLRLATLTRAAESLEQLAAIADVAGLARARPVIVAAKKEAAAARDAARAAARDAAGAAAGAAAWDAAWAAARAAARDAAGDAARAAAWDAAWAAARAAARDAAGKALRPTVEILRASALKLFDRMIDVGNA